MIIEEVIRRECCDPMKDLEPLPHRAGLHWVGKIFTCKHCGQVWTWTRQGDAAGGSEKVLIKIEFEEDK